MNNQNNKPVEHLNETNFDGTLSGTDLPVIVDFWAPWCAPCRMLGPIMEEVATAHNGKVKVVKVNVDENPSIAERFGIRSIPTVKVFLNKTEIGAVTGVYPRSFWDGLVNQITNKATGS